MEIWSFRLKVCEEKTLLPRIKLRPGMAYMSNVLSETERRTFREFWLSNQLHTTLRDRSGPLQHPEPVLGSPEGQSTEPLTPDTRDACSKESKKTQKEVPPLPSSPTLAAGRHLRWPGQRPGQSHLAQRKTLHSTANTHHSFCHLFTYLQHLLYYLYYL